MSAWVSVDERMPEVGQTVLLWVYAQEAIEDDKGKVEVVETSEVSMGECRAGVDGGDQWIFDWMFGRGVFEAITHWMPLPGPPSADKKTTP